MSAAFNAGSIEGSLKLDTRPFTSGLMKAREDARRFAAEKFTKTLNLEVDNSKATAAIDKTKAQLDILDKKKTDPKVKVETGEATAKILALSALMRSIQGGAGIGKKVTGISGALAKPLAIAGGLLAVTAAAGPATVALTTFGAAAGLAFAGAGASLGIFAKMWSSNMADIKKANVAGLSLTGPAGQAQKALAGVSKAWNNLRASSNSYGVMTKVFNGLASILPRLAPLMKIVSNGLSGVVGHLGVLSPVFNRFLKSLQGFMGGFLKGLGPFLTNMLGGLMRLFIAAQPAFAILGKAISDMAAKFKSFSVDMEHGGVRNLLDYIGKFAPLLNGLLGDTFRALGNILGGIAPLAGPALKAIDAIVKLFGSLNLKPIAQGFGDLLGALTPMLPVLGQIVNTLLPPLGALFSSLAKNVIGPLSKSLSSELSPALSSLSTFLTALVDPLSKFLGSIANLVNPTGISLLSTLLTGVLQAITPLLDPIAKVGVALESLIDNALKIIIPMLPGFAKALGFVARALVPLANGLASILSHQAVAGFLLALATAAYGVKWAFAGYALLMKGVAAAQGIAAGSSKALAGAMAWLTGAQKTSEAATIASGTTLISFGAAEDVAAVGARGMGVAMRGALGPIGLVISLVAVAVIAFKKIRGASHAAANGEKAFGDKLGGVTDLLNAQTGALTKAAIAADSKALADSGAYTAAAKMGIGFGDVLKAATGNAAALGRVRDAAKRYTDGVKNGTNEAKLAAIKNLGLLNSAIGGSIGKFKDAKLSATQAATAVKEFGKVHGEASIGLNTQAYDFGARHILSSFAQLANLKGTATMSMSAHASGGITTRPHVALVGDNPGGHEAIIPLEKYDLPKKGEMQNMLATALQQGGQDSGATVQVLAQMVAVLDRNNRGAVGGDFDQDAMVKALTKAFTKSQVEASNKIIATQRGR